MYLLTPACLISPPATQSVLQMGPSAAVWPCRIVYASQRCKGLSSISAGAQDLLRVESFPRMDWDSTGYSTFLQAIGARLCGHRPA